MLYKILQNVIIVKTIEVFGVIKKYVVKKIYNSIKELQILYYFIYFTFTIDVKDRIQN